MLMRESFRHVQNHCLYLRFEFLHQCFHDSESNTIFTGFSIIKLPKNICSGGTQVLNLTRKTLFRILKKFLGFWFQNCRRTLYQTAYPSSDQLTTFFSITQVKLEDTSSQTGWSFRERRQGTPPCSPTVRRSTLHTWEATQYFVCLSYLNRIKQIVTGEGCKFSHLAVFR